MPPIFRCFILCDFKEYVKGQIKERDHVADMRKLCRNEEAVKIQKQEKYEDAESGNLRGDKQSPCDDTETRNL